VESEDVRPGGPEPDRGQAVHEVIRVDGREDVVCVARPNGLEIQGLLPDEEAAWS
jgi:hypothetical protein